VGKDEPGKSSNFREEMRVPLFWFFTGMMTTVAILCVLLPWLRTLPRFGALPALPWQASLVGLLMIVATLAIYRWLGHPDLAQSAILSAPSAAPGAAPSAAGTAAAGSMQSALASLEARLAKDGGSPGDWELLAKSYEFLGRPDAAAQARKHELPIGEAATAAATAPASPALTRDSLELIAEANRARSGKQFAAAAALYAQLAARGQMNADTWADYADAAASAQGGKLAGVPESYIAKALALDPKHVKALWLRASADEESGRMAAAAGAWQQLLALLPPDSSDAKIVVANLRRDSESTKAAGQGGVAGASAAGMTVSGEVSLSTALRGKVPAAGTLFIVAKSVESPGAPVAVYRGSVGAWPVTFTLDDSQSMLPGRNLSNAGRVTIEARISQSGQALPASGDLRGSSGVINPADRHPLKIVIDEVIS
jgi:cytochrome c-type biogenesis protein CcmH